MLPQGRLSPRTLRPPHLRKVLAVDGMRNVIPSVKKDGQTVLSAEPDQAHWRVFIQRK
jgi:hypothetical protein